MTEKRRKRHTFYDVVSSKRVNNGGVEVFTLADGQRDLATCSIAVPGLLHSCDSRVLTLTLGAPANSFAVWRRCTVSVRTSMMAERAFVLAAPHPELKRVTDGEWEWAVYDFQPFIDVPRGSEFAVTVHVRDGVEPRDFLYCSIDTDYAAG